jgi:hypothetical protein
MPSVIPIVKALYRHSFKKNVELEPQLKDLLNKGYFRPCKPPWCAPMLFQKKKNDSLSLCVIYRGLYIFPIKNKYPTPIIDKLVDHLSGAKKFSNFDLKTGYNQLRIKEYDIEKMASRSHFDHCEYLVLSFGHTNVPTTLKKFKNTLFK